MIRLVACDLDGTLLDRDSALPEGVYDRIAALRRRGIRFAAASGRQYSNVRRLFWPVRHEIDYLCENGSLTIVKGQTRADFLPRPVAEEIIRDILAAGLELLLCVPEESYMLSTAGRPYVDEFFVRLRNTCALVDDPFLFADEYVKISGFRMEGVAPMAPALQAKWGRRLHCDVAGDRWLDFTGKNKGDGIRALSEALNIPLENIAAFGDHFNDESMLEIVGHPYIMAHAPAPLLQKGFTPCRSVMETLDQILAEGA